MAFLVKQVSADPLVLNERSADPSSLTNAGQVYTKEIAGRTELFHEDDAGNVTQITSVGLLNAGELGGSPTFTNVTATGWFRGGDGSAPAPTYSFSSSAGNTGMFSNGGDALFFSQNGVSYVGMFEDEFQIKSTAFYGFSSSTVGQPTDLKLYREAAAVLQMGADVNGAAVAQTFKAHDGITGTDIAGASLTLAGGRGTGAGTGSSLIFSTATTLGTGTTAQTLVARLTLSKGAVTTDLATLTFADKVDLVFNATTGTKIGTAGSQKIGFYGATPVVQPTGVAVTAGGIHAALVTLGLITA